MRPSYRILALLVGFAVSSVSSAFAGELAWPEVTREAKPWTRWWWPGSGVDEKNLTRELTMFRDAGLGGVEITPIYGAKGYESRFVEFLSPRYVEILKHTTSEAARLGMAVDMATGTGWPFGGKQISADDAELKISIKDGKIAPIPTGFRVKRSAPGGEGLVVNPYSTTALSNYLAPFTAALKQLPKGAIHGQFHDSFEYQANWAKELPARFYAMHGYNLADHEVLLANESKEAIAALSPADVDKLARIKSDYRETIAAMHMDYICAWVDWSHSLGGIAREQAHGAPANLIDLYALADIPETEIFGSSPLPIPGYRNLKEEISYEVPQPLVNRLAASAAHLTGKKLVSSETFTWAREHFHEAPSELKPELDQLFLTGVNHVFYHGTAYSPDDAQWPGWLFYASTQYNNRNSLWNAFSSLNTYIARVQSFLQMGEADNTMLVYWPMYDQWHRADGWSRGFGMHGHDWLTENSTGEVAQALMEANRQFDFVSDALLQQARSSTDGPTAVQMPNGKRYSLIVPKTKYMPAETYSTIVKLLEERVAVYFLDHLPSDVPGWGHLDERRITFKNADQKVQKPIPTGPNPEESIKFDHYHVGKQCFDVDPATDFIESLREEAKQYHGLRFIRRKYDEGCIYFVANLTETAFDGAFPLSGLDTRGTAAQTAAVYDPMSGVIGLVDIAKEKTRDNQITSKSIRLQLDPGESLIIKTSKIGDTGPAWKYRGKALASVALDKASWRVTFTNGAPELPSAYTTNKLTSWTDQGGEAERFAGTARYETKFTLPNGVKASDWEIDLGDVREVARVFVNGKEVDFLWCLPFRTSIGKYVKEGENTLAIEVTNLSANRVRDLDKRGVVWKNFYEINFVNVHYKPIDAGNWPLQPSGLLGPVKLTPIE